MPALVALRQRHCRAHITRAIQARSRSDSTRSSCSGFSESNHREFYRRWQEVMDAPSWRELARGNGEASETRHA